jgi:DNA ligase (NAD+)
MIENELVDQIKAANFAYWVQHNPIISDSKYDSLIEQLRILNPDHNILDEIGTPKSFNSEYDKIIHSSPMLSLEKVFNYDSILSWMKKISRNSNEEFLISPKYDGISARYYVSNNLLATRGDGNSGENISNKLQILEIKSNRLEKENIINGEIIITNNDFNNCTLSRKDGSKYATPRNLVAGIMNLKDVSNIKSHVKLTFIDHQLYVKEFKFNELTLDKWNELQTDILKLKETIPLDGIVIELKDAVYGNTLGNTAHHPRSKVAFKFENEFEYSIIKEVVFKSGKRKLTPTAIIEPVIINGVTITRASMHNAKMLLDNNIHIGDKVKIVRSGDVIPYIAGVYPGENRTKLLLERCPHCGSDITYIEPELYCDNENCSGSSSKLLYESVRTLGIDEVGLTTVEKFIDIFGFTSIIDILDLDSEDIENLAGFGKKSAINIISNINKIKNKIEDYKVLACLNIQNIGTTICKELMTKFTIDDFINMNVSYFDLNDIRGIGDIRASQIINDINDNIDLLIELKKRLTIINTKDNIKQCVGNICFSGSFPNKKDYYRRIAINKGFNVTETVTKELDYLVSNGASTSKASKARKFGIPILTLEEFDKL